MPKERANQPIAAFFDVKFYPYTSPDDDPIFAATGTKHVRTAFHLWLFKWLIHSRPSYADVTRIEKGPSRSYVGSKTMKGTR